jgi:SAM-dependent methyltransferase
MKLQEDVAVEMGRYTVPPVDTITPSTAILWANWRLIMRFYKLTPRCLAPTTEEAVEVMLKLADVKSSDIVYDLGCGDGRIVIAAAKDYGAHGVGIDINPERIQEAEGNAQKAGVDKLVRFEENDLFDADIQEASVVTLFLLERLNLKLRPKLLKDLNPGTRIVSNTFNMGDWTPDKEFTLDDDADFDNNGLNHKFFFWIVPQRSEN